MKRKRVRIKPWISRGYLYREGVAIDRWNIQESGTSRPEDRPGEWIFEWVDQVRSRPLPISVSGPSIQIGSRQIAVQFPRTWPWSRVENLGQRMRERGKKKKKRRSGRRFQTHRLDDEANQVTEVGVTCDAILNQARGVSWKRVSNETKLSVPRIFKRGRIISLSRNQ